MSTTRPGRRQAEMNASDLDFDYFADTTGLAGDDVLAADLDGLTDLVDLYAEIAEIEDALAELDTPVAPVITLPIPAPWQLGEVA
jgi:hypothetical protein